MILCLNFGHIFENFTYWQNLGSDLMQIKIILSIMVLFSLVFLAPSDVFANDGNDILEIASLEYSGTNGRHNSLVQVDSDTYALAYAGTDDDGYISTFTISSDGKTITKLATLEHAPNNGEFNSLVQVDSDTYALAYAGNDDDGWITTFTIPADGSSITKVKTLEHAVNNGQHNSLVQVDSDTYALAYAGGDDHGWITTFTIPADGSSITKVNTLQHDGSNGTHNSLLQIDSDTYALAYSGHRADGYISTFTIDSNGNITAVNTQSEGNNFEHDENKGEYNSLVQVDSDTYALAYSGHDSDGYISTFTIDSDGAITPILIQYHAVKGGSANLEHDENKGIHNSLVQVDSDTYALAYTGINANGFISTFTISSDGSSIVEVETLEHDTDVGNYNSLVHVDSDTYALAYTSGQKDGWIMTFTIPSDEIKEKTNDCYDCEAPKLTKVEVHITSPNSDTQRISTSSEIWNFDQDTPLPMFDNFKTPIVADPGDEVEIILELTDNRTLKTITDSGTYTNFLNKPDDMNLFYANNFDKYGKVSTTFYEWYQTGDDLFYDYANTVEWSEAYVTIQESGEFAEEGPVENSDELVGTFTISFTMKFLQPMQTTDVWIQVTDLNGNFFKVALPLTLEISGPEPLVFDSPLRQKVVSFFDEEMLAELVSNWDGSSQDVAELELLIGIPAESVPKWVVNLATWVSEDKITTGDMIIAIEHVINN